MRITKSNQKKNEKKNYKKVLQRVKRQTQGITLIALVVTVIVLLILAGVAINLTVGENGLFRRAQNAADTWQMAEQNEQSEMDNAAGIIDDYIAQNTNLDTSYGKIDVVWLNTNNEVIESPNSPANYLGDMTPIYWTGEAGNYKENKDEGVTDNTDNIWYNYTIINGTEDNTTSRWANAIDENENYFVWIPRFAYRITYYVSELSDVPTGYYDGRGLVDKNGKLVKKEIDGKEVEIKLEEGIETVESNGKSYIVHPAFIDDSANIFSNGGWDSDLAGIWVGKYETSEDNSKLKIIPNVESDRSKTVGEEYTYAYNYNRNKESHLMKNSEWGAVAYLTHSQYGRNGHEVYINNSDSYITGNSGGSVEAKNMPDITNAYNTEKGVLASSTGNIYGIYDLSGCGSEDTAAWVLSNYNCIEENGGSFASENGNSTKYATAYVNEKNGPQDTSGERIYLIGKTGDATKEVYSNNGKAWFNDNDHVPRKQYPFWIRGGFCTNGTKSIAGIFYSYFHYGKNSYLMNSYRIVLV